MPVSGLVIRTVDDARGDATHAALAAVSGLSLGDAHNSATPAVLEALDYADHDAALQQLLNIDGVCAVDVVFHDFSDVSEFGGMPRGRQRR
jgi:nitrate reductase NapAB chaperone NapD